MAAAVQLAVAKWEWAKPYPGRVAQARVAQARTGTALDLDASLVERCLNGTDAAWEELVKLHTRREFAICIRFTGPVSEAHDPSQTRFLRCFTNLNTIPSHH